MAKILIFPATKYTERRRARNQIAALVNATGSTNEINAKLTKLLELLDRPNAKVIKFEQK